MAFSHVQSNVDAGNGTSVGVLLGATPSLGSVICVAVGAISALGSLVIQDTNGNGYTLTSNSPANNVGAGLWVYLAYLLITPSNATANIIATWTGSTGFADIFASEFSVSGGTQAFDTNIAGTGNSAAVTGTISTPSITAAGSGELLYSMCVPSGAIIHPLAGVTLGGWTGAAVDLNGPGSEYILSSGVGATAVDYTDSTANDPFAAMAMAFKINAPGAGAFEDDSFQQFQPPSVEPTICVW